jgi:hypothetical protein
MSYQSQLDKLMQMATIEQLNLLMRQFNIKSNNNISTEPPEILSLPIVQKVILEYEKELQVFKDKEQQNKCSCCCQCDVKTQSVPTNDKLDKLELLSVIEDLHKSCSTAFLSLEKRLNEVASCVDKLITLNNEYKTFVNVDDEPYIKIEKVDKVETTTNTVLSVSKETEHIKLEIQEKVIPSEVVTLVKEPELVIDAQVPIVDKLLSNIAEVNDTIVEEELIEEEESQDENLEEDESQDEEVSEEEVATDVSEEDIKETQVLEDKVVEEDDEVVEEEDEVVEEEDEVVEEEDEDVEEEDEVVEEEDEDVEEEDEVVEEVKVEEEEEEVDEEVFEIEIDDVTYYATDEENGILYEVTKTGDVGKKVGIIKDGEPIFS